MFAGGKENPPQIHQTWTIEAQCFHSRPAAWSQADNERAVLIPGKMIAPDLLPRMEQRHRLAADRVGRPCVFVFVIIATLAGKRQILWPIALAVRRWVDVLNRN